ncbi:hypothetical protein HPB50_003772 [Hyalomma asiaticum]|uniref:Uncharacterized protein n=1 Tax=Hyalomma asiaticum TaxID=266040 RepID=A0ACB7S6Q7_HYAAI|nr:hypothetical protein HPB50_003772 [Hyalomma asiaticum]
MMSQAPVSRTGTDEENEEMELHAVNVVLLFVIEASQGWLLEEKNSDSDLKGSIESTRVNRPINGQLKAFSEEAIVW